MIYYVGLMPQTGENASTDDAPVKWVRCRGDNKEQIKRRFRGNWKPKHVMTESELYAKYGIFWAGQVVRKAKETPVKT